MFFFRNKGQLLPQLGDPYFGAMLGDLSAQEQRLHSKIYNFEFLNVLHCKPFLPLCNYFKLQRFFGLNCKVDNCTVSCILYKLQYITFIAYLQYSHFRNYAPPLIFTVNMPPLFLTAVFSIFLGRRCLVEGLVSAPAHHLSPPKS